MNKKYQFDRMFLTEKNNKILKEGLKNVLNSADVSELTGAIKDFTDILEKTFSER